ncbi:MAG: thioredoxin domain-containing protein [Acidobacteriota bacterium]
MSFPPLGRRLPVIVAALLLLPETSMSEHVRPVLPSPTELKKLPADGGPKWNRLVFESSPYLRQHAGNPVDWHPWGDAAFEKARKENKPVFLSIGYSTCHWCHVMEHESFENEQVAELMNRWFVSVKVDREERPDLDQVYMTVTQAMTGRGGWPMTVVLTPDRKPFFSGTYFPMIGRPGRPGMLELLHALHEAWTERHEEVVSAAADITERLADWMSSEEGKPLGAAVLAEAKQELISRYDKKHGGFGNAPKFPTPHVLSFLLRQHHRTRDIETLRMVEVTLREMRDGGLFDQLGLGFHRYSTDREWLLPHFEKMLYDQALLLVAYAEAEKITGRGEHGPVAAEIVEYVLRDMTSPEGAFYSAEDADSEGEEGKFYVWTVAELKSVLGEKDGALLADCLDITLDGNFRDEATGRRNGSSVPRRRVDLVDLAKRHGTTPEKLDAKLASLRAKLFDHRETRVHPYKDDKVLTDWNGLMIAALARAGRLMEKPEWIAAAARAADFVLKELRDDRGRLLKRYRAGEAGLPAVLDDHAFLGWGLIELHQSTLDPRWLKEALTVTDQAVTHFWDEKDGGFFLGADDGEPLLVRGKEIYDGAQPSGNSVLAWNLLRLARLTGRHELEDRGVAVLTAFAGNIRRSPSAHCFAMWALDFLVGPSHEIVIAGQPDAEDVVAMLDRARESYRPNDLILLRPSTGKEGEADPDIVSLAAFTKHQVATDGRATAYVCIQQACREPTTDPDRMLELLEATTKK